MIKNKNDEESNELYKNAIWSIELGIEDFDINSQKRSISAVRNLYSGILLLLKCIIVKNSEIGIESIYRKNTKITIGYPEIKEKFKSISPKMEWGTLDQLNDIRNNLEHFHYSDSEKLVNEYFHKSYILLKEITESYVNKNINEVIDNNTWKILNNNQLIQKKEKQKCLDTINGSIIDKLYNKYESIIYCRNCNSSLLMFSQGTTIFESNLVCRVCNSKISIPDLEDAIEDLSSDLPTNYIRFFIMLPIVKTRNKIS